jgi:hypothetical protein
LRDRHRLARCPGCIGGALSKRLQLLADPDAEGVRRLVLGYRVSQAIFVAAELGIADLLASGLRTAHELASAAGAHAPSLHHVLRFLASEGVFAETEEGRLALTPMAATLQREAPGSVRALARQIAQDAVWRSRGACCAMRTGESAFEHVHGVDLFGYNRKHRQQQIVFDELMTAHSSSVVRTVAAAYDLSGVQTVVDVGGGRGALVPRAANFPRCLSIAASSVRQTSKISSTGRGIGKIGGLIGGRNVSQNGDPKGELLGVVWL